MAITDSFDEFFEAFLDKNTNYIAPEILNLDYSEKSDIWSAGLVLFFILTKKDLFTGKTSHEIQFGITNDEINF